MIADKRILLVDDDKSIRTSLTYYFRKKTKTFKAVASAEEAERVLYQDRDWDVVISDYKLPGMDGIAFLKRLRASQSQVLVALITAYASMDIVTEALRAGIHDFIQKPLKAGMISDAIERMLVKSADHHSEVVHYSDDTCEAEEERWREDLEFTIQKVTHQMNNTFMALRGKAELGLRKTSGTDDVAKFADILDILKSGETLNKELMAFGKALTTRSFMPVDVMELIRQRTFAHAAMLHEAGVRLCIKNVARAPFIVSTCEEPLNHIIDNIFINAIQGFAGIADRKKEITVTVGSRKGDVVVRVEDNGIGMTPQTLEKAGLNGFTTKPDGNGLGLFICSKLCQVINVSMRMDSREGQGTAVTLTIPHRRDTRREKHVESEERMGSARPVI
jgi:signal transduction histidine kinase